MGRFTAQVAKVVTPIGVIPATVGPAREIAPLVKHHEQEAAEVWRELNDEYGENLTAEQTRRAVQDRLKAGVPEPPETGKPA